MHTSHTLFVSVLICILAISCTPKTSQFPTPTKEYTSFMGLPYGTNEFQKMDLYLPAGRSNISTPVIIMIHGGGWVTGDRSSFPPFIIKKFTSLGYAVANIDYRLVVNNTNKYPAALDDVDTVLNFLKSRESVFDINHKRIALLGRSAGGHIALLYAYTRNHENNIKAAVDFFGPADLTDPTIKDSLLKNDVEDFIGTPYYNDPMLWHSASPIFYAATAVPTYICQGLYDETVYPIQSQRLRDSLAAYGIPYYYDEGMFAHSLDSNGWEQYLSTAGSFILRYTYPGGLSHFWYGVNN